MCSIIEAVASIGPTFYEAPAATYVPPHAKATPPEVKT